MHRLQELVRLHREGVGARKVAQLLKMSTRTEIKYRKALQHAGLLEGCVDELPELAILRAAVDEHLPAKANPGHRSTVVQWTPHVTKMLARGAGPRAIYDRLRQEHDDFQGSYAAVKRLCRKLKREASPSPNDVKIPVVTQPGEVAQVDFGYLGRIFDPVTGTLRKAYAFIMVLGFSRLMFVDIVFDQKVSTWLRLHTRAFEFFGGVPRAVVPDNLKSAVIKASFSLKEDPVLNRSYRELARHYGFLIDPTPPYAPEKKGKVESQVKYVRGNFYLPREFRDIDQARAEVFDWNETTASQRIHGTTQERPRDRFEREERAALLPLPEKAYEWIEWHPCKVRDNAHVLFERRFYSVPWEHLGKDAMIRANTHTVMVFCDDQRVATHPRSGQGSYSTLELHLPVERAELRQRSLAYWQERASAMGADVRSFVDEIIELARGQHPLRKVQSVIRLLDDYPAVRANAACRRAAAFGNFTWKGLRRILRENLDQKPIRVAETYTHGRLASARFARSIHELLPVN